MSDLKEKLYDFRQGKILKAQFTTEELTVLYNKYYQSSINNPLPLFITLNKNNDFCFSIYIQYDKPVRFLLPVTVTGYPNYDFKNGEKRITSFTVDSISLINIPIPEQYFKYFLPYFRKYYSYKLKAFLKKIIDIDIDKNKDITITGYKKKLSFKY